MDSDNPRAGKPSRTSSSNEISFALRRMFDVIDESIKSS
jgi:hypothetical protein